MNDDWEQWPPIEGDDTNHGWVVFIFAAVGLILLLLLI